ALGDRSYTRFCAFGALLDRRLGELGAKPVAGRIEADVDTAEPFARFSDSVLEAFAAGADAGAAPAPLPAGAAKADSEDEEEEEERWTRADPYSARLLENVVLNGPRSDKETRHIVLSLAGA